MVEQILRGDVRRFTRTATRVLMLDGAAMTLLVGDGAVRMVEDVYTTPAARGRGHATALVKAQPLYERLGFAVIARTSMFFRPPG